MPELPQDISKLPSCLSTLKKQTIARLPLLPLRKKKIPLQAEQLSREKNSTNEEDLIFFDPVHLFASFIASNITNKMHSGLGEFHDTHKQDELYKSHSWLSSIRATSGQFAHYSNSTLGPIFPSDFVSFRCNEACRFYCKYQHAFSHVGRVMAVGRDHRTDTSYRGSIVIQIQEVLDPQSGDINMQSTQFDPPLASNERLLSWNNVFFVHETDIVERLQNVKVDYAF